MNKVISEIEFCSKKMKEIESRFNLTENSSMNLLYWKWHETRRGMIMALRLLGLRVECIDTTGMKWGITGTEEVR